MARPATEFAVARMEQIVASSALSKPGTKHGPCKGSCAHLDCKSTREVAASPCRICAKPIGFDRHFYIDAPPNVCVHAVCYEEECAAARPVTTPRDGA